MVAVESASLLISMQMASDAAPHETVTFVTCSLAQCHRRGDYYRVSKHYLGGREHVSVCALVKEARVI